MKKIEFFFKRKSPGKMVKISIISNYAQKYFHNKAFSICSYKNFNVNWFQFIVNGNEPSRPVDCSVGYTACMFRHA